MSEEEAVAAKMLPPRKSLSQDDSSQNSDYYNSCTSNNNSGDSDAAAGAVAGGTGGELDMTQVQPQPSGRIGKQGVGGGQHVPVLHHHHRLQGSAGNLSLENNTTTNGGARTPRSRSRSPSIGRDGKISGTTATTAPLDGNNSSISSFDDYDQDILTDRAGTLDELSESQRKLHSSNSKEMHLPATVLERMSEEALEDVRAFADVARSSNCSRVSHVSGSNAGDAMLEPLDECDEGLEENSSLEGDDDYYPDGTNNEDDGGGGAQTTVILTNMENLNLTAQQGQQHFSHHNDHSNVASRTGESSAQESQAPSQPTA